MTQQIQIPSANPGEWAGDALYRRRYSEFLTQYIDARVSKADEPLTIALDASWGAGKTFFVDRWSKDLIAKNGGVILFDAWKNDFSADVVISFMAELTNGMKPLRDRISRTGKAASDLKQQTKSLMSGFRKAAMPAAGVIAKGVFAKITGVAIDQITEAYENNDPSKMGEVDWDKLTEGPEEHLEKGLEKFFEKTLEAHKARSLATDTFRTSLEILVQTLQKEKAIEGPLYIFVDELDRCRPDYAIKLLEGIKHLFAVKGVVFVVSTNLDQLSKSVQAVYGGNFDGYSYLKRFFDFEFALPAPDVYAYAQVLAKEIPLFSGRKIDHGLDEGAYRGDDYLTRSFELIATACKLQLRDQRQVWLIASAAAAGIPANVQISVLWLFFLSVLKHNYPAVLEAVGEKVLSQTEYIELYKNIGNLRTAIVMRTAVVKNSSGRSHEERKSISLADVLSVYQQASFETIEKIEERARRNDYVYPSGLISHMVEERPNAYSSRTEYRPAIAQYPSLVRMAGLIK